MLKKLICLSVSSVVLLTVGHGQVQPIPTPGPRAATADQVYPSPSQSDRTVITPSQSWESGAMQEPNIWYYNGYYHMIFTGGYSTPYLGYAYATNPKGPWTQSANPVIGNGFGGTTAGQQVAHTGLYIEGSTVYITSSIEPSTGPLILWSFPIAFTPASGPTITKVGNIATLPSGTTAWGNSQIIAITPGSSYALLTEAFKTGTNGYQVGLMTATGALSSAPTFTATTWPLTQLNAVANPYFGTNSGTVSGPWTPDAIGVHQTGSGLVTLYFHAAGQTNSEEPTEIFAAQSPVNDLVNWTALNGGYPVYRRQLTQEVSQAADPSLVQGPGGDWWLATDATFNENQQTYIVITPAYPILTVNSNGNTVATAKTPDYFSSTDAALGPLKFITSNYTAVNHDNLMISPSSSLTITLPPASPGEIIRLNNVGAGQGSNVTIAPNGSDTLLTTTMNPGYTMTLHGNVASWMTEGIGGNTQTFTGQVILSGSAFLNGSTINTGLWVKSGNSQMDLWNTTNTNGGRDNFLSDGSGNFTIRACNDAGTTCDNAFNFVRSTSSAAISSMNFGNGTDNPTYNFLGTNLMNAPILQALQLALNSGAAGVNNQAILYINTSAGTDLKRWLLENGRIAAGEFDIISESDAGAAGTVALAFTRASGTAITDIAIGNATDNPTLHINGTAGVTCSGSPTASFATVKSIVTHC